MVALHELEVQGFLHGVDQELGVESTALTLARVEIAPVLENIVVDYM